MSNISVFELIYQRSFAALVIVSIILYVSKISCLDIDREVFKYVLVRILGSAIGFIFQCFALEMISASKAVIVIYNPFITALVAWGIIGERISKHDVLCFFVCTLGVLFLTNPFSDKVEDVKEYIGMLLAFLASFFFNVGYVALRKIRNRPVNSWVIVFFIMVVNCMTMPTMFLSYDVYLNQYTYYDDKVWIIIFLTGVLTVFTLYFTNLMFFYEKASRGAAYHNFELIYTYFFDVFYMH